jgi:hypothetical protein
VVFVSHQLGHAKPTTTLAVYAHLFDQAEHAHTAPAAHDSHHRAMTSDAGREPGGTTEAAASMEPAVETDDPPGACRTWRSERGRPEGPPL